MRYTNPRLLYFTLHVAGSPTTENPNISMRLYHAYCVQADDITMLFKLAMCITVSCNWLLARPNGVLPTRYPVIHSPSINQSHSPQKEHYNSIKSMLAVWLTGNALASIDQRSCATSDPVSTRMGDHLWTGKPARYITSQLGRLSLLPSVGR